MRKQGDGLHVKTQRFASGFVGILNIPNKFTLDEFTINTALHLKTQRFARGFGVLIFFCSILAYMFFTVHIALHYTTQRFARGFGGRQLNYLGPLAIDIKMIFG